MKDFFKYNDFGIFLKWVFFIVAGVYVFIILPINIWAYRDIEIVKENAPALIEKSGFENITYAKYSGDIVDGGSVEYIANKVGMPNLLYCVGVCEWRGDYMIYKVQVLNTNYIIGESATTDYIPTKTD